jgi:hypothetical protein
MEHHDDDVMAFTVRMMRFGEGRHEEKKGREGKGGKGK